VTVVAHPTFGFAGSDLGTGFTWSENSHDNRLTPWRNDPVIDPQGEAIYFRDDESGRVWSATPLPAGGGQPYTVRHGQGYSVYEHARDGIESRLRVYVAAAEPVKVFQIGLRNASNRRRQLTVTIYAEWVLGENRDRTALHIVTRREPTTGALIACNAFRDAFADRVAFLDLFGGDRRTITGDRTEFIGRRVVGPNRRGNGPVRRGAGSSDPRTVPGTDRHRAPRRGGRRRKRVLPGAPLPRASGDYRCLRRCADLLALAARLGPGQHA
jgi:cellobiose phosphorylase